ncbi:hypothetical protein GLOTRDRAFT_111384 [Gloeophyllum trabeum ATCC 11539]|uniref:DUF4203 domain-containing protein n=1 Tax=Gloeophyllum trabeum (strain ATCC 11539 / FP-39264 / Madison 617) TaxID=670483 RepID=S7RK10_GLOTA|nr:uncharacterized protein GLOTRDRAFT_111384 [Gloeophyllum trabeum ATCC 11539]EPQ54720.1 hypothetical protein GLOTRDRAFT_111384 [Gloeophyllum trabeum ATCC 11539]
MSTTANTTESCTLTSFLPTSSYTLAYALPLLFISFLLTYAGAFLTLDRTRTFAPSGDTLDLNVPSSYIPTKKRRFVWLLEGGLGGLASGYAFGVHCSTFLSLLIPNTSSSVPLNSKSFLAVWVLSAVVTTILAGRWKYTALLFAGISGGTTLALSFSVIVHPSLLTRIVLPSVSIPILTILVLLPFPRVRHASLRIACSSTGAFGLVVAIAILNGVEPWADVWQRLWVSDGPGWGVSKERGLSAGYCLFLATGIVVDWFLKRRFGENPDQKWDSYLANYTKYLPNAADRAGQFQPLRSAWSRWFPSPAEDKDPLFPPGAFSSDHVSFADDGVKKDILLPPYSPGPMAGKLQKNRSVSIMDPKGQDEIFEYERRPAFLRKASSKRLGTDGKRTREAIKFRPLAVDELSSDSEDDSYDLKKKPLEPPRPTGFVLKKTASVGSGTTAVEELDMEKEKKRIGKSLTVRNDIPEYSDYEEDVTVSAAKERLQREEERHSPGWSPEFIRRASLNSSSSRSKGSVSSSQATAVGRNELVPPPGAVPMTPSLIKAVDRIAAAQQAVYGAGGSASLTSTHVLPGDGADEVLPSSPADKGVRWDAFWRDVKAKAAQETR